MKRLLAIEWSKLFYNKTTRNFTIIYFLILLVIGAIMAMIKPEVGGLKLNLVQLGMFDFPVLWQNVAYILAIAKIFLAVIIISNITIEYENSTIKQNLIDGLTKQEFLVSKLMSNIVLAVISTAVVWIIALVLGFTFSQSDTTFYSGMSYILDYFIKMILFFTICSTFSILLRKTSYAFLGLIAYWIIEGILSSIDKLLIKAEFVFSDYLPLSISGRLVPFPDFEAVNFVMGQSAFKISSMSWSVYIMALLYIGLFAFISGWVLKKRDL